MESAYHYRVISCVSAQHITTVMRNSTAVYTTTMGDNIEIGVLPKFNIIRLYSSADGSLEQLPVLITGVLSASVHVPYFTNCNTQTHSCPGLPEVLLSDVATAPACSAVTHVVQSNGDRENGR